MTRFASILIAGPNFGTGSSREHAVWAILDYGFEAVISPRFADIFRNNSLKNGLLPLVVDEATHGWLLAHPGVEVEVDRREVDPGALRGPHDLEIVRIVVHEDREVIAEAEPARVEQLGELVRPVIQLAIRDRRAAPGHHRGRPVGVLSRVRGGPHRGAG